MPPAVASGAGASTVLPVTLPDVWVSQMTPVLFVGQAVARRGLGRGWGVVAQAEVLGELDAPLLEGAPAHRGQALR